MHKHLSHAIPLVWLSMSLAAPSALAAPPVPAAEPPSCRNWYPDCDGDGYGDSASPKYSCVNPNWTRPAPTCAYLRKGDDCNDADATISPAALEGPSAPESTTDGIDNDCDGYLDIDCDGTSDSAVPEVLVESPARGLFTYASEVDVTGWVLPSKDKLEVTQVQVQGQTAELTQCSDDGGALFSATVPLSYGVQTLSVVAEDALSMADRALTSVVRADRFMALPEEPVRNALVTQLNQGAWNIMGDYLEGYYSAAEIKATLLASNPLLHDSGDYDCLEKWEIYADVTDYTHNDMDVSFTVTGGRIAVQARLIYPQMWAQGWGYYDLEWYCGGWSDRMNLWGYASFSEVNAYANGWLSLDGNGQVQVNFTDVRADASGPSVNVSSDDWFYDFMVDLFEDSLASELESTVESELYQYVAYDLGPDLAGELNELDLSYTVDVSGIPYGVKFGYDSLKVQEGGVSLGFNMRVNYAAHPEIPANPGAVGLPTNYTVDVVPTLGLMVSDDFFNASMHALWEGGSLSLDEVLWNQPTIVGVAAPLLPPVLVPGTSPYLLQLSIGDLLTDLSISATDGTSYQLSAALSTSVPATLIPIVDGTLIRFDVEFGEPIIAYDVLGGVPLPVELLDASEAAMSVLMGRVLEELEAYMEALEISTMEVPMTIQSLTLGADPANAAMLDLDLTATYAGP